MKKDLSYFLQLSFCTCLLLTSSLPNIQARKGELVTCGSVIKIRNTDYNVRLHSHDVKYGKGSTQQSVTAIEQMEDVNSHWIIKAPTRKLCHRGEPIKCGDIVRLEHLSTSKNLHSHHFQSPLSGYQEVSAFGNNGEGDSGDHWTIICDGNHWERDDDIMFRHVDTSVYLSVSGEQYGQPINGQMEVVGTSRTMSSQWKAAEGLYIHPSDFNPKENIMSHVHTEL